ncbi:hypothetical protein K469DRAFT_573437, partial [Zopfia rhizophila CBS 207.26]
TLLNAEESPLLKLPAELRNNIYGLVFSSYFIHVEYERKAKTCRPLRRKFNDSAWVEFTRGHNLLDRDGCLHYYLCKAPTSERDAYQRSKDPSLNEQVPGESERMANYWRLGDPFHIDSCKQRHDNCYPQEDTQIPGWMMTPQDRTQRAQRAKTDISLYKSLNLNLLETSRQIYQEAKNLPFSLSTFGFTDVVALLLFLFRLEPSQANTVRSIWMFLRAGRSSVRSDVKLWNNWLFAPGLLPRLQGLRVLHISISIANAGMGDKGPLRGEFYEPHLNSWVLGLNRFRGLPLEEVMVIVSDDPSSMFGIDGYENKYLRYAWQSSHESWLQLRQQECFAADEKRQWGERLRKHLLREISEI